MFYNELLYLSLQIGCRVLTHYALFSDRNRFSYTHLGDIGHVDGRKFAESKTIF